MTYRSDATNLANAAKDDDETWEAREFRQDSSVKFFRRSFTTDDRLANSFLLRSGVTLACFVPFSSLVDKQSERARLAPFDAGELF